MTRMEVSPASTLSHLADSPNPDGMPATSGWFRVANAFIDGGHVARLSGSALRVWLLMMRMANRENICWPTLDLLARLASIDRATVSRAIAQLIADGVIVRLVGGNKGQATRYKVMVAGHKSEDVSPNSAPTAASVHTAPVHEPCRTHAARTILKNKTNKRSSLKASTRHPTGIVWSIADSFQISEVAYVDLQNDFPLLDVNEQLHRADAWLKANPDRARKRNWHRFITNWLLRSMQYENHLQRKSAGIAPTTQRWQERHPRDRALQL